MLQKGSANFQKANIVMLMCSMCSSQNDPTVISQPAPRGPRWAYRAAVLLLVLFVKRQVCPVCGTESGLILAPLDPQVHTEFSPNSEADLQVIDAYG